jgi:hypothetical protein
VEVGRVGYGVIHDSIFDSSVADDWKARVVLQDMVVLANEEDKVMMTLKRYVHRSGLPAEVAKEGVEALEAPDPEDKSGEHEGRRLIPVKNPAGTTIGWFVVNRGKYKRLMAAKWRRQYRRDWMREHRNSAKNPSQAELSGRKDQADKALKEFRG